MAFSHLSRFWGSFSSLCLLAFISSLDVAVITTALPSIISDLGGATQYVWVANSFILASSVLQPVFGQVADIFGRQPPLLASVGLFLLGSGIAGGATQVSMLTAGRVVQGVGACGLYVLIDIVCCDLVPLRQRGKYVGILGAFAGLAAAVGPFIGGILASANWRWIFYINLPVCGVALVTILLFMRLEKGRYNTLGVVSKLRRLDYVGAILFTSSVHILVPIVVGVTGWALFHIQQAHTKVPSIPPELFTNRTSATAYCLTFLSSVLVQLVAYFLPVYFQGVKTVSPSLSGVYFLPFAFGIFASAVLGGVLLTNTGTYKPFHAASFAISAIGFGLFTLLDHGTPKIAWVLFQFIAGVGAGLPLSTLLPAIMVALPESRVAGATAAYTFTKTFGYIWGVMVPSIIFNTVFNANLGLISSEELCFQLRDGAAYAYAGEMHRVRLPRKVRDEVIQVYTKSLKTIWWTGLGISLAGFLLVWIEEDLELRTNLVTDYGLERPGASSEEELVEEASARTASPKSFV